MDDFFGQLFDPSTQDLMAFPGFSFLYNPEFQQRWEFRNRKADSSSDDAKSDSGTAPTSKKHKMVPGLIPPEDNGTARSPGPQEAAPANPEVGLVTPNPKEAARKRRKEKLLMNKKKKMKKVIEKKTGAGKSVVYDVGLVDDLIKYRESVIEELRVETENLFGWMKDEMNKLVGMRNEAAANDADRNCGLRKNSCRVAEKGKVGDGPSGRSSSRRKKKAEPAIICSSQALPNEKRTAVSSENDVKGSKFPFLHLDRGLTPLQQNGITAGGGRIPASTVPVEKDSRGGGVLQLLGGNTNRSLSLQLTQAAAPADQSLRLKGSSFSFPLGNPGKNTDAYDEFPGYYHMPRQEGSKNNTSLLLSNTIHRDTTRLSFSSTGTNTNLLPSQNPLGGGGPLRLLGLGSNFHI